jgi:4-amino-4-deoxy-L-arabinose transferase-like glycosyltransferase
MIIPASMLTKLNKYLIYFVLLLALFLRVYKINTLPSLNPDEAALGYNAYSLLETGKDEHGTPWPLHFQSFGDFKPGGYVYLDLPFIKVFGLTPLAVRLPNLIFSVLTIYVLFQLVYLLSSNFSLSILSASVLALSPWHIHFSRGAWESSTALFFITLGVYWLYLYLQKQKKVYLYLFTIPVALSFYIYHSARIVAPCLFIILFILNFKKLFQPKIIYSLIIGAFITIPVLISFFNNGGTTRFNGVGITADYGPIARTEELLNQHGTTKLINRIIHNKIILYTLSWAEKYTSHFDLNFLFISGDEVPRSKSPDMGQLYFLELPLLILGIIYILKSKSRLKQLFLPWLFIAPIASSLTFQAPSALRSLSMIIPLSVLIATGIYYLFFLIPKSIYKIFILILILLYSYSLAYFLDAYFFHAPQRYSFAWNSGFSDIIPYVESQKNNYQNIYFTDKYDQPYILYLFFSKYPPKLFQPQSQLTPPDKFGFSTVSKIDNITFNVPELIPINSLVIDASDYQITGKSFKIYNK